MNVINFHSSENAGVPLKEQDSVSSTAKKHPQDVENQNVAPAEELSKAIAVEQKEKVEENKRKDDNPSQETLDNAIEVVSEFMNQPPRNVNFSQTEHAGKTVIKILNASNGELIKQFPSEKIVEMAEKISSLHQEILAKTGMIIDDVV